MKAGLRGKLKFTERLGFRLAFLLSVALLPLGTIALVQTWRMAEDAERAAESALLQRTSNAAAGERAMIESALGASEALSQALLEAVGDNAACSKLLGDYVGRSPIYAFAGFIPTNGQMTCSSRAEARDMTQSPTYKAFLAAPRAMVTANATGEVSREPVLIVSQPVSKDGVLLGMLALSVKHSTLELLRSRRGRDRDVNIVMFNHVGEPLFVENHLLAEVPKVLPMGREASTLVDSDEVIFRSRDGEGRTRVFAVLDLVPNLVHVVGSWPPEQAQLGRDLIAPSTLLFPLTMWITSLLVAYAAVDRLVIRHVRELRGQMRRFALGRRDTPPDILKDAPAEIADVSQTFHNLARILIRDEAELEASLQEKTVLLKEIHHRVKNNLQLIASIMNMQIRQVNEPGARRVLKSVQDRVASLATIHRNLYQAETLSAVQADQLLGDIVSQMTMMSVAPGSNLDIRTDFAPVTLYPDQAVPVSLLATEALTNAVKYASAPEGGGQRWIRLTLHDGKDGTATLAIVNSQGSKVPERAEGDAPGIGTKLINAFAGQLDSMVEIVSADGEYRLSVRFEIGGIPPADGPPKV
ncbi:histidine kinase [Frigidibacter albus]|uniref:histidine kinase n=1 Tax=Frigidibacter albus TaxID=1465486 RepID=A0A6L8VGX2_9RHOB|nr:sensor histidine kinase [Frigidibacter albus]MZQ89535.1 histidine kinase [Frigidibacter albus]NBE31441.1 histidine kinase [Frigidibacter albus]GGH55441.1 histidine kinase [Frigidibacter albus]